MMKSCVFCRILAGELPVSLVHEDEHCIAFMDIHPIGEGHVLVIPRQHATQLTDIDAALSDHLFHIATRVLNAQRQLGWGRDGSHILLNDGPAANQQVPHIHVHVIPRRRRDGLGTLGRLALHVTGVFGLPSTRARLDEQAAQLRQVLAQTVA